MIAVMGVRLVALHKQFPSLMRLPHHTHVFLFLIGISSTKLSYQNVSSAIYRSIHSLQDYRDI